MFLIEQLEAKEGDDTIDRARDDMTVTDKVEWDTASRLKTGMDSNQVTCKYFAHMSIKAQWTSPPTQTHTHTHRGPLQQHQQNNSNTLVSMDDNGQQQFDELDHQILIWFVHPSN